MDWSEIHYWKNQADIERENSEKQEFINYPMAYFNNNIRNPRFSLYRVEIEYEDPWGWNNNDNSSDIESDYESDTNQAGDDDDGSDSEYSE